MYNTYGAIKKDGAYEFRLYAPNAENVSLVLNGQTIEMSKEGTDFVVNEQAEHMDAYYFVIDGVEKFDPFARYITDGGKCKVYEGVYNFKHQAIKRKINGDSKVLEIYLPFVPGNTYKEKAVEIVNKVNNGNFTHVLLLPIQHHWYIGSLGYHTQGFFAPTWFYGTPDDFKEMVDILHKNGTSIILDYAWWETTESPSENIDDLFNFAGDIYLGNEENQEFGGRLFNFSDPYVLNFMRSSIDYWLNIYNIDFIKLDGINEFIFTQLPEHHLKQGTVKKVNELTEGFEDRLILEFIDIDNPESFGFNVKRHDGIILPYLLQALYRDWNPELTLEEQNIYGSVIDKVVNDDGQLAGANHNLFLRSTSYNKTLPSPLTYKTALDIAKLFIKETNKEQRKELLFILKLIYATKRPLVEFGHLDVIDLNLANNYSSYKEQIDTIYSDHQIIEKEDGLEIQFLTKDVHFNLIDKEVVFVEKQK
jgi:hypothetical protein